MAPMSPHQPTFFTANLHVPHCRLNFCSIVGGDLHKVEFSVLLYDVCVFFFNLLGKAAVREGPGERARVHDNGGGVRVCQRLRGTLSPASDQEPLGEQLGMGRRLERQRVISSL